MITVGIDPGLSGAIAWLNNGQYANVLDIPVVLKGAGSVKSEVDPSGLRKILVNVMHLNTGEAVEVLLERVSAMPGQGVSSVFSFGDTYGCCRSVVACMNLPLFLIPPATWKKYFKLGKEKEEARALAIRLFPEAPLNLKKHADRAEALLMARYLWETRHQ